LKVYGRSVNVSELAKQAGIAPSAVRFYEETGVVPSASRKPNGYRTYDPEDLARLRLVVALRRLGLGPSDAGRLARLCIERGDIDADLAPLIAEQRLAIERQRVELDRLDAELSDLDETIRAVGRTRHPKETTSMSAGPIRVLFVCTGNSARSQIAEALLRQYGGDDFAAFSAGTEPHGLNPLTVMVLAEAGIDWSKARSKSVMEFLDESWDYVITVCDRARQVCPAFPGEHNSLHWGLDDPAEVDGTDEQKLAAFRATQMQVGMRIRPFVELARRARRKATTA
jgi:arsenate reductase